MKLRALPPPSERPRIGHFSVPASLPLRPATAFFKRLAGFEETLEARQDHRPSARNGLDELRVGFIDLVDNGELDRLRMFFELIGQARMTFGAQLRSKFVAPCQAEPPLRLDFENLATVGDAPVGDHDPPGSTWLPFGFLHCFAPVAPREFGGDQR